MDLQTSKLVVWAQGSGPVRHVHLRNYLFNSKSKYVIKDHIVNTRLHDGPVFNVPKPNNDIIKKSVLYSGAIEWNNLDSETRNINEIVQFKRIQKAWMLSTIKIVNSRGERVLRGMEIQYSRTNI